MERGALSGLRVVECAVGVAGPYCGKLLAGLGADVLKLEPPDGDETRRAGPFRDDVPDVDASGLFLHLNTRKRSAVVDLSTRDGRETFDRVLEIQNPDVLLLSHRPAQLSRLEIDLASLRERFPALVIVNLTSFGMAGPYSDYSGKELVVYAASGYMMLTGDPDREPIKAYGSLVEYQAGTHAALGTMAALFARRQTGEGQIVDVAAREAGSFLLGGVEQAAHFYGRSERRNGARLMGFGPELWYPSTIRPCRDGFVHAHTNNRHPDLLGALIPNPRLLDPDLLRTMMGHADEIDAILDDWMVDKMRSEIVAEAQELRLPFTEVLTPVEVLEDPHNVARDSFVSIEHPKAGVVIQPGAPFRMHATPWVSSPAPALGQHNGEALTAGLQTRSHRPLRAQGRVPADPVFRPLQGVRVVDFTTAVAGPLASSILGTLGAEVIKVESPYGRPQRPAGTAPSRPGSDVPPYDRIMFFNLLNHSKRGISLDVSLPEGRDLFLQLVSVSDVVIQNYSPRAIRNLRLEYDELRSARPDVIAVSMPAFGLAGPYRDRGSYGPGIDAMSGLSHLTGYADGPPLKPGNFFCDQNAAVLAALATLAAVWHRRESGAGQHVELPMLEGEFQVLGDAYIDWSFNRRNRTRAGNEHPSMAPHGVFPCEGEDSWVAIEVGNDEQWTALCKQVGRAELADHADFSTAEGRHQHRLELASLIATWTEARDATELQDQLQAAGVPAAAVLDAVQLLNDPHVTARRSFEYVDVAGVGPTPHPRVAFTLSETPVPINQAAPAFAEANDYVFQGLLGLTPARQCELERLGVTAEAPQDPTKRRARAREAV